MSGTIEVSWWRQRETRTAHAFIEGQPGWTRSACAALPWTTRLVRAHERPTLCRACLAVLDARVAVGPVMGEAEAREAWGR